jgi:hypothetical protein
VRIVRHFFEFLVGFWRNKFKKKSIYEKKGVNVTKTDID